MKQNPQEYTQDTPAVPLKNEDMGGMRWKPGRPAGWQPGRTPPKHSQSEPDPFLGVPLEPQKSYAAHAAPASGKAGGGNQAPFHQRNKITNEDAPDTPIPDVHTEKKQEETDIGEQTAEILETGGLTARKGKHILHCLTIIGQIEGHYILPAQNKTTKYEHVIPQLLAVEQDPEIQGLVVILNTVGGDVEAGLAIAELLSGMKKPTVSLVLGGGHSIGVPLAVSCRKSFIVPSATMTVHPVRMNGLVLGIPQTLSYFDRMQERIVNFVTANSRISRDRFRALMMNKDELVMDVGSVLDGQSAVEEGLIDSLGGISDVIGALYEMIEGREGT